MEDFVAEILSRAGIAWQVGEDFFVPDAEDVRNYLDAAVSILYDGPIGQHMAGSKSGLIIEKADQGYDVYVYVGNYN